MADTPYLEMTEREELRAMKAVTMRLFQELSESDQREIVELARKMCQVTRRHRRTSRGWETYAAPVGGI